MDELTLIDFKNEFERCGLLNKFPTEYQKLSVSQLLKNQLSICRQYGDNGRLLEFKRFIIPIIVRLCEAWSKENEIPVITSLKDGWYDSKVSWTYRASSNIISPINLDIEAERCVFIADNLYGCLKDKIETLYAFQLSPVILNQDTMFPYSKILVNGNMKGLSQWPALSAENSTSSQ